MLYFFTARFSAASGNGTVDAYVQKGRNVQARLSAFMIAHQLNRQSVADNITEVQLTTDIRSRLLSYIEGLPIRDVVGSSVSTEFFMLMENCCMLVCLINLQRRKFFMTSN